MSEIQKQVIETMNRQNIGCVFVESCQHINNGWIFPVRIIESEEVAIEVANQIVANGWAH